VDRPATGHAMTALISPARARALYADNDSAHGFDHVLRVWRMALRIGEEEHADLEIVSAAALLHDLGRATERATGECHAVVGARMARQILSSQELGAIDAVSRAIAQHRYRADSRPDTIEAQVLFDADKLDAIGAIGVARAYAVAGAEKQHLWAAVPDDFAARRAADGLDDLNSAQHTPVHEFRFKLSKLKDGMLTRSGVRIATQRHRFMCAFFDRLLNEVGGEI